MSIQNPAQSQYTNEQASTHLIGSSVAFQEVRKLLPLLSSVDSNLMLSGAAGVGKKHFAKIIHNSSNRKNKACEIVNADFLTGILLESELFGHQAGAFQGAYCQHIGALERANGGTIIITDINKLSPDIQNKLCQALDKQSIQRLGSDETININVRIIACSKHNISLAIKNNDFSAALYDQLSIVNIHISSLSQRPEDIPLLASHFIKYYAERHNRPVKSLSQQALAYLQQHHWSRNIQELKTTLEQAIIFNTTSTITRSNLALNKNTKNSNNSNGTTNGTSSETSTSTTNVNNNNNNGSRTDQLTVSFNPKQSLKEALSIPEKQLIIKALKHSNWNRQQAADTLQVTRSTLYHKMKKHKIHQSKL